MLQDSKHTHAFEGESHKTLCNYFNFKQLTEAIFVHDFVPLPMGVAEADQKKKRNKVQHP